MSKKLSRRSFLQMAASLTGGAVLAACQPTEVIKTVEVEVEKIVEVEKEVEVPVEVEVEKIVEVETLVTPTPDPAIQGELTIDMQYVPGKITADTPKPLYEILRIAEEYESMHPGVKVTFEEPFRATDAVTQTTYYKMGAAAGTLPDISFTYGLSFIYDKGALLPTTEFLDEPNDYIPAGKPGSDRWIDQWFDDVQPDPLPDGNTYDVPVGWGGPGLVIGFNKEMFESAGITTIPSTYYEYYQISEQLLDSGVVPCESKLMSWEWDRMTDYLTRSMGIFELIDLDENGTCDVKEETRGAVIGLIRCDAPYWVESTRIYEAAANRYYQPGYLAMAQSTAAIGTGEILMTEQSAMMWNAGQIWSRLMSMGGSAKWGVFNLPRLTDKMTPFGAADSVRQIGRSTQTKTITKTCEDRGHVRMAVDFLKFMTTPTNSGRMIEERLGQQLVLPTLKGLEVAVTEDVALLVADYEEPTERGGFSSDRVGDWHFWYEWFAAIQGYLGGSMTLNEMIMMQVEALPQFLDQIIADSGWEADAEEWEALKAQYATPPWGEYEIPSEPYVMPFLA